MKRDLFILLGLLVAGAVFFNSCAEDDPIDPYIELVGGDVELQLGEEFEDPGYTTEGIADVQLLWNPEFDKHKVNHYVLTYVATDANVNAQRNVYVKSDRLAGLYSVTDEDDEGGSFDFEASVVQSEQAFNRMFIQNFGNWEDITNVVMEIIGDELIIEKQELWTEDEWVEATGTYNGETRLIEQIEYTMVVLFEGEPETISGVQTFHEKLK